MRRRPRSIDDGGLSMDYETHVKHASRSRNGLCNVCDQLDIPQFFSSNLGPKRYFGTWEEVQKGRACPLCKLVAACVESPRPEATAKEVKIYLGNEKIWRRCVTTLHYDGPESKWYSNMYDLRECAAA
jgi:hypothetical protein